MHTSLSKKLLAGLLSLVMVLSLVAPSTSAQAATKYSLTDKKSVKSGVTFKYELKGVSKGCYVKVTRNVSGEKVVYNKKELTKTTKVNGTGKTLNLYVTYGEKDENYTGKFTVKVYGKKTNKLYKTLVEEVTVKVPEKEEPEEPEEKEAELVGVDATGAKTLTVVLSAAATVTSKDFVVKKGTATPNINSVETDGNKVKLVLGSKMTAGTYEVTYKDVTKSVDVKDETLTTLAVIGTNLAETSKATSGSATTATAEIGYQALNQYGERMMHPGTLTVTCSFGTAVEKTAAGLKADGVIEVKNIPSTLAILGTSGSITLVDSKTGVNSTATITYSAKATLSEVSVKGIYNTNTSSFEDLDAGDSIANYVIVFEAKNQYGATMDKDALVADKANIAVTSTPVMTNVKVKDSTSAGTMDNNNLTVVTIDGTKYPALMLVSNNSESKAVKGTMNLLVVNTTKGVILSDSFTIGEGSTVKSINVSASDTIYAEDANVLNYEVLDSNGNAITKYDDLKDISITTADPADKIYFSKKANGTADLIYVPNATGYTGDNNKMSVVRTATFTGNAKTASVVISTSTFNVYTTRKPEAITGYNGSTACANGKKIAYKASDFVIEDQYGNAMKSSQKYYPAESGIYVGITEVDGFVNSDSALAAINNGDDQGYHYFTPTGIGSALVYASLKSNATKNTADCTFTIYSVDATKATDLRIAYVNWGYDVNVATSATSSAITASLITVKGMVSGKLITIPTSQYTVSNDTFKEITNADGKTTKTAIIEVTVDTMDGDTPVSTVLTAEYNYSNKDSELAYICAKKDVYPYIGKAALTETGTAGSLSASDFVKTLYVEDQYGSDSGFSTKAIKYTVASLSVPSNGAVTVKYNNTNDVQVALSGTGEYVFSVTAVFGDYTVTQIYTYTKTA